MPGGVVGVDELAIGTYRNPPPWDRHSLVFTDKAIYLVTDGEVDRIALGAITDCALSGTKAEADGVTIKTRDDTKIIRATGSHGTGGKFKDAYSLLMVLRAIVRSNVADCAARGPDR